MNGRIEKNKWGIAINKACISCQACKFSGNKRICTNSKSVQYMLDVKRGHMCELWEMKKGLQNAGKGGGDVKKIEYLREVLDSPDSILDIRDRFVRKHGSIYLTR